MALVLALSALLAAPALAKRSLAQAPTSGVTDADIANFALNLEYLEAEFYSCAAYGTPIPGERLYFCVIMLPLDRRLWNTYPW